MLLKESVVFVEVLTLLMNGFMMYENDDCMQAWCWFTVLRHSLRPKIRRSSKSVVFCSGTQTAALPIKLDRYPLIRLINLTSPFFRRTEPKSVRDVRAWTLIEQGPEEQSDVSAKGSSAFNVRRILQC